jgi:hypothetical protein
MTTSPKLPTEAMTEAAIAAYRHHEPIGEYRYSALRAALTAALAVAPRDEEPVEKRAPVQGYRARIPWAMHLRAYDAYCKRYGRQDALIDLEGRNCRGGFSVGELDVFIPGWRDELSEIAKLKGERDDAFNAGLEAAAVCADNEEELDGDPPWPMSQISIYVARAIVRATKKSIATAIRARKRSAK